MEVTAIDGAAEEVRFKNEGANLGKDDFLKLMIAQLQNQDPLNPTSNQDFAAQMAQFSSLEQMQNLNNSFNSFAGLNDLGSASSLIGKHVTFFQSNGIESEGVVDKITVTPQGVNLIIAGETVPTANIKEISATLPEPLPDPLTQPQP